MGLAPTQLSGRIQAARPDGLGDAVSGEPWGPGGARKARRLEETPAPAPTACERRCGSWEATQTCENRPVLEPGMDRVTPGVTGAISGTFHGHLRGCLAHTSSLPGAVMEPFFVTHFLLIISRTFFFNFDKNNFYQNRLRSFDRRSEKSVGIKQVNKQ